MSNTPRTDALIHGSLDLSQSTIAEFAQTLERENAKLRELLRLCKPAVRNVYPSTDPLLEAIDAAMKEEGK